MIKSIKPLLLALALFFSFNSFAQTGTLKGRILNKINNEPIPFANVIVDSTGIGVTSDFDGNYTITLQDDNSSLIFSYLGFLTQTLSASSSTLDVSLLEDVAKLEEVVVTGYGSTTKKSLTGAIGTVSAENLTLKPAAK